MSNRKDYSMDDLYDAPQKDDSDMPPPEDQPHGDDSMAMPILVNKSVMPNAKPGDMLPQLRVVKVHNEELECEAEENEDEGKMPEGEPEPEMASSGMSEDSMMG